MEKYKICIFVPFYPLIKGGAEYQSKIIATELQKLGHEIIYISSGHEEADCKVMDGFKVHMLPVKASITTQATLYRAFMKKVCNIIAEEKPTVVYQRILNTFTYRLSGFAKKSKIPFVLHIADNYSVEFSDGKIDFLKKRIFKKVLYNRPTIICQTNYQKSKIEEHGYSPFAVMPNMHPKIISGLPENKEKRTIVWVGNARPVKQLEVYVNLANIMKDTDYRFHIIGKLPEGDYGHQLQKGIDQATNITYHGSQNNDFVNDFFMKSAILVNTSVSEGFSNTFIQAWLCATPVLALNSDPDGILTHYDIGIDCKGNKASLPNKLKELLSSDTYDARSKKALDTALALFSTEKNMAKFVSALENAIE